MKKSRASRFPVLPFGFILAPALIILRGAVAAPPYLEIDSTRQLFLDDRLLDTLGGVVLHLHTPQYQGTVLQFDKPWEGRYSGYVTVLFAEGRYHMYYRGLPTSGQDGSSAECTCYAESRDGLVWEKPSLGLFEVAGTKENNVVLGGMPPFSHNFAPFYDTKPGVPPEQRFKALAGLEKTGLHAFVSTDGIHWTRLQDEAVIRAEGLDSQNVAFWSDAEGVYVCYYRYWTPEGYRSIARTTSADFVTWTPGEPMRFGGAPLEHLYTNQTVPYFRAPHIYVSLASRFAPMRRVLSEKQIQALGVEDNYAHDLSDVVLMSSRGGNEYARIFLSSFVRPRIGPEHWTSRSNYAACGIVPTSEEEISFYVQEAYALPTARLARYSLRTDGFVSIRAPYAGGAFTTKPLIFTGTQLYLNFSTSAVGGIRVECEDEEGAPLPGYSLADAVELVGNALDEPVRWVHGADWSPLSGKPIRLRFVMRDADLYSFQFR